MALIIVNGMLLMPEPDKEFWAQMTGTPLPNPPTVSATCQWRDSLVAADPAAHTMVETEFGGLRPTTQNQIEGPRTLH